MRRRYIGGEKINFVAVGFYNTLITSTDGFNWTETESGVSNTLKGIAGR